MVAENFETCLAVTLKWEGGYSNHPDDPGGPTMRGIIQREYDAWRKKQGKSKRPVRQLEEAELRAIYRTEYWDAMGCDGLPAGLDLCVFDAAVNSGVGRAKTWLAASRDIDGFCDERLEFLQRLGKLWRVFGPGWRRRVNGIRSTAHRMTGVTGATEDQTPLELHAGMRGQSVLELQRSLRALGYPIGNVDGIFGDQTYRAVILYQHDNSLAGDPGIWKPEYAGTLANAGPMMPKRADATHKDLEERGDKPVKRMNLLQRVFGWIFGSCVVSQAFDGQSVVESIGAARQMWEPAADIFAWASTNVWLLVAVGALAVIVLIRFIRADHVAAYQSMDYQGPRAADAVPLVPVEQGVI